MEENVTLPFISVVIACRNEMGFIQDCIHSLIKQKYPNDRYEIRIYDGLSTDGTYEYIKNLSSTDINIISKKNEKLVQAAGWNLGFQESKAEYVVMMGAHTTVPEDFLMKNIEMHQEYDVPATGGLVVAKGSDSKSKAIAMAFNSSFGAGNAKYWFGGKEEYVETVAFGLYKREIINEVGYLDESIVRGQDWELNYRISKKYGKFLFSPIIKSYYSSRTSFKKLWKRQFAAGYWKIYIFKKHPDSILLRHIIPILFSFTFSILLLFALVANQFMPIVTFIIIYLIINLYFSLKKVLKEKKINYLPYISWAFSIIHFAYGFGALVGIVHLLIGKFNNMDKSVVSG